jgi:DNA-directed RNA polymerase specialized sigma24 family protein
MRFLPTITDPVWPCEPTEYVQDQRSPWAPRELQVLRERYLAEGVKACRALLPARTRAVIMNKAAKLGLKRQKAHAAPKASNEILDAAIKRIYQSAPTPGALGEFCQRHGITRQWLYRRARDLGITYRVGAGRGRIWTEEETALLEKHAAKTPEAISRVLAKHGFARPPSACASRRQQIGLEALKNRDPDRYSANDLALLMGVDSHSVLRWIHRAGLPGVLDESIGAWGTWRIHRDDVRDWLIRSVEWDHRKCNREWLIEILAGRVGLTVSEAVG